jgi:hypothetical protein
MLTIMQEYYVSFSITCFDYHLLPLLYVKIQVQSIKNKIYNNYLSFTLSVKKDLTTAYIVMSDALVMEVVKRAQYLFR